MRRSCKIYSSQSLSVSDYTKSLPSSLEDSRLKRAEVHDEGWYVEPVLERVEELAPAIFDFLSEMSVGQKVMILDNQEQGHSGKI